MVLIWSLSGKPTRFLSCSTDMTFQSSSSDLLNFTLLLPFTWTNYFMSNSRYPLCPFGQKFFKSNVSSLFSSDKNILSLNSIPQKYLKTIANSVLAAKSFRPCKKFLSSIFLLTQKSSLFFACLFYTLPLESKQRLLTLSSVLACADSAEELRFWKMSGS